MEQEPGPGADCCLRGDLTGRPAEDAGTPAPQLRESRLPDSFQTSQPAAEKDNEQFLSEDEPSAGRKGG